MSVKMGTAVCLGAIGLGILLGWGFAWFVRIVVVVLEVIIP